MERKYRRAACATQSMRIGGPCRRRDGGAECKVVLMQASSSFSNTNSSSWARYSATIGSPVRSVRRKHAAATSRARLRAHARRCRATRVGCLPPTYCYPVCNARVPHLDACRSCFTCCCLVFLSLHVRHRLLLRVWTKKCTRRGYEEK